MIIGTKEDKTYILCGKELIEISEGNIRVISKDAQEHYAGKKILTVLKDINTLAVFKEGKVEFAEIGKPMHFHSANEYFAILWAEGKFVLMSLESGKVLIANNVAIEQTEEKLCYAVVEDKVLKLDKNLDTLSELKLIKRGQLRSVLSYENFLFVCQENKERYTLDIYKDGSHYHSLEFRSSFYPNIKIEKYKNFFALVLELYDEVVVGLLDVQSKEFHELERIKKENMAEFVRLEIKGDVLIVEIGKRKFTFKRNGH